MLKAIRAELAAVERETGVRVLYALESGSRTWGFASEDSDFDVRFVYVRPLADYLRLEGVRDTIEWRLDETLDVVGWDVTKFLSLMRRSNPTVFEWLGSAIVYREEPCFEGLRRVASSCFDPMTCGHHYLGMAARHDLRHLKDARLTPKRYLYAVRSLLSARWAIERQTPVPQDFCELCSKMLEPELAPLVGELLERKVCGAGQEALRPVPAIDAWAERTQAELGVRLGTLAPRPDVAWEVLDEMFLGLLGVAEPAGPGAAKDH